MPKVLFDMRGLSVSEPSGPNRWSIFLPARVERDWEPETVIMGFGETLPQALRDLAFHIEYTEKNGVTIQEAYAREKSKYD